MRGRDTFNQHVRPSLAQLLQHRAVDGEAPQASPLRVFETLSLKALMIRERFSNI